LTQLTDHQLAALRRIRTASGVWRHWVQSNGLGISGWTWGSLYAMAMVERRELGGGRQHAGRLSRYAYRLTDAGHEQVALFAARDAGVASLQDGFDS